MHKLRIVQVLRQPQIEEKITIEGWIRTVRHSKATTFISINDGSCLSNLQVVADSESFMLDSTFKKATTGASMRVTGRLVPSPAKGQEVEVRAEKCTVLGAAPQYPLQKKRHSFEFLRDIAHLRPRTNSLGAVARVRSALAFAAHSFFNQRGFFYIHTPIISTGDCEGAGETFTVTALDAETLKNHDSASPWAKDFFGQQANLTVSGQLQAEAYALALGNVYTFGPTFRAENSNTSRHLAEFWMIEPEMAFCSLEEDIDVAEAFVQHLVTSMLTNCEEDLALFQKFIDPTLMQRLHNIAEKPFVRLTYSDAVDELQQKNKKFRCPVSWGIDLQAEHERYLTEEIFNQTVVLTDYPKKIKPFYMRLNGDQKTVAAMDILVPGIGEIIGGSQREERLDMLLERMTALNMNMKEYNWYIDLRRYGSVSHAGFGLGFERMVQFVTGMKNIRDVIPFPRTPGNASY